ncbi:MAG: hypothetical protein FWC69_05750 [Defluviitaleaceae bacterium]|nr:hypothetical protein [Defluviitaleaceae bacterium]
MIIDILISFGIALVIAGITMYAISRQLKSVRQEHAACNYERKGSFRLTAQRDSFLYRNVSRTPRSTGNTSRPSGSRRR